MRISKEEQPVRLQTSGAVARQRRDFGDAGPYSTMCAERFTMDAGTDIGPLLRGLPGDLCQAPHWGYLVEGAVTVTYTDGSTERMSAGEMFYWPPGHTVRVDDKAELVMFSPQREHDEVLDHMREKLGS
jgi:hypothetical protein